MGFGWDDLLGIPTMGAYNAAKAVAGGYGSDQDWAGDIEDTISGGVEDFQNVGKNHFEPTRTVYDPYMVQNTNFGGYYGGAAAVANRGLAASDTSAAKAANAFDTMMASGPAKGDYRTGTAYRSKADAAQTERAQTERAQASLMGPIERASASTGSAGTASFDRAQGFTSDYTKADLERAQLERAIRDQSLADREAAARANGQTDSMGLLKEAAYGKAPSAAEMQMKIGLDQGLAAQQSLMGSARGQAALAMAGGNAMANAAAMHNRSTQEAAQMRANEMATARGAYTDAANQMRAQDLSALGLSDQFRMFNTGQINQGNLQNAQMINQGNLQNAQQANQVGMANAGNLTNASLTNSTNSANVGIANANNATMMANANAQRQQEVALANAFAANQANQYNSQLQSQMSQYNAGQVNQANQYNAGQVNQLANANADRFTNTANANAQRQTETSMTNANYYNQNQFNNAQLANQYSLGIGNVGAQYGNTGLGYYNASMDPYKAQLQADTQLESTRTTAYNNAQQNTAGSYNNYNTTQAQIAAANAASRAGQTNKLFDFGTGMLQSTINGGGQKKP